MGLIVSLRFNVFMIVSVVLSVGFFLLLNDWYSCFCDRLVCCEMVDIFFVCVMMFKVLVIYVELLVFNVLVINMVIFLLFINVMVGL